MRSSLSLLAALGAVTVMAAPTYPSFSLDAAMPGSLQCVSDYFNMLAEKVQNHRWMSQHPVCDVSKVALPAAATPLPPPSVGLVLKHIAIGRGTQNYTCDVTNATAIPVAVGAVATLFNATCVAATYPDLANLLPAVALQFNLTDNEADRSTQRMAPSNLAVSGHHFFTNTTTPFFTLDTAAQTLGEAGCAKNASVPAPTGAPKGQKGEPAVAWLKLLTRVGATGQLQEVYRVETAGGSAPATCKDMPAAFEVQYAAQYWFYASPSA